MTKFKIISFKFKIQKGMSKQWRSLHSRGPLMWNKGWLTENRGRSLVGAGAAVVVGGAGVGLVTWSAGSASGTVCNVGRIVVDIFASPPVQTLIKPLARCHLSHPPHPPCAPQPWPAPTLTRTPTQHHKLTNNAHLTAFSTRKIHRATLQRWLRLDTRITNTFTIC